MNKFSTPPKEFNLRTFDLNLLKIFDAVMTERSLTQAAKRLALTQPAVSNALRRLRETTNDALFVRKGRGLEPTVRAVDLWPVVREVMRSVQNCLAPDVFEPQTAKRVFVLSMADSTAAQIMPSLVNAIENEAPSVTLRVLPLTTRDPRRLLDDGEVDLAIGHFPAALADLSARAQGGENVSFLHKRLFSGDYVCVMRKGHPLADAPLSLEQFCSARHMLVSFSGRAFGFVDEALAQLQRKRLIVLTVNQFFTAGKVVSHSNLLTVLPRHFIHVTGFASELVQRDLPFAMPPFYVDALWHLRADRSVANTWLLEKINALDFNALPE